MQEGSGVRSNPLSFANTTPTLSTNNCTIDLRSLGKLSNHHGIEKEKATARSREKVTATVRRRITKYFRVASFIDDAASDHVSGHLDTPEESHVEPPAPSPQA